MKESRKTIRNLAFSVVGMFAFAFLLVPIYDVFCEITGLNGKILGPSALSPESIKEEEKRELLIQFVTHNNEFMPWTFKAKKSQWLLLYYFQLYLWNLAGLTLVGLFMPLYQQPMRPTL